MIELLILFELNKRILTMYGISKEIRASFSVLTTPSYGTIKPALNRLEKAGFVKKQKSMSEGGRPSNYYSITKDGVDELRRLILAPPQENPIQFLPSARIKLACADLLEKDELFTMLKNLKLKSESILADIKNLETTVKQNISTVRSQILEPMIKEYDSEWNIDNITEKDAPELDARFDALQKDVADIELNDEAYGLASNFKFLDDKIQFSIIQIFKKGPALRQQKS